MKLENQVCSIELARKLGELGVTCASYFVRDIETGQVFFRTTAISQLGHHYISTMMAEAFTVAELGEMFATIEEDALDSYMDDVKEPHLSADHTGRSLLLLFSTNPDFLCSMLIWSLENGHVTAEQINGEGS